MKFQSGCVVAAPLRGDTPVMARSLPSSKAPLLPQLFVREWRTHRRMTQEQLAEQIDYSTSTVSQLESGKQGYSPEILARLARALDCEVADLFRDPSKASYEVWELVSRMPSKTQSQALRLLRALQDSDTE